MILFIVLICAIALAAFFLRSLALMVLTLVLLIVLFVLRTHEGYSQFHDPKIAQLREQLALVFPESRNVRISGSDQSFTLNKEHIFLCIKDEEGQYYDDNSLMYVLLHEYAHVLCDEIDTTEEHKPKFQAIFAHLLDQAAQAGIYNPEQPMVANYCGYS